MLDWLNSLRFRWRALTRRTVPVRARMTIYAVVAALPS